MERGNRRGPPLELRLDWPSTATAAESLLVDLCELLVCEGYGLPRATSAFRGVVLRGGGAGWGRCRLARGRATDLRWTPRPTRRFRGSTQAPDLVRRYPAPTVERYVAPHRCRY